MYQKIKEKLNNSYPVIENTLLKIGMSLGVGLFTFLFLFIYKPLGVDSIINHQNQVIFGYAILVSIGLLISYFIVPLTKPSLFSLDNWKVKHEVSFLVGSYLGITLMNYIYHNYVVKEYVQTLSFVQFLSITFSIGIIPIVFLILLMEVYLAKRLRIKQELLIQEIQKEKELELLHKDFTHLEEITIVSENITDDNLVLPIDYIIYGQSSNNYSNVCYLKNGEVNQTVIRISLKKLENQLNEFPQFKRCHRSYIVNKNHILSVDGNSRTTNIRLKNHEEQIPVSRSFPKEELVNI